MALQTSSYAQWDDMYVSAGSVSSVSVPVVLNPAYITLPNVPDLSQLNIKTTTLKGNHSSTSWDPYSCISYAKYKRPDQTAPWGTPNKVQVYNFLFPFKGLLVITKEGPVGHVGYVEEVKGDMMRISETNYRAGKYDERWIEIGDPVIRGFR